MSSYGDVRENMFSPWRIVAPAIRVYSTHPLALIHQPPDAPMALFMPPVVQLYVVSLVAGVTVGSSDILNVNNESGVDGNRNKTDDFVRTESDQDVEQALREHTILLHAGCLTQNLVIRQLGEDCSWQTRPVERIKNRRQRS